MQTEISSYIATGHRDVRARLVLQRANIMHLVDVKRGGYSPRRTEMRIGGLTARPQPISILSKRRLLLDGLCYDKFHRWTLNRFGHRLSITKVVLLSF